MFYSFLALSALCVSAFWGVEERFLYPGARNGDVNCNELDGPGELQMLGMFLSMGSYKFDKLSTLTSFVHETGHDGKLIFNEHPDCRNDGTFEPTQCSNKFLHTEGAGKKRKVTSIAEGEYLCWCVNYMTGKSFGGVLPWDDKSYLGCEMTAEEVDIQEKLQMLDNGRLEQQRPNMHFQDKAQAERAIFKRTARTGNVEVGDCKERRAHIEGVMHEEGKNDLHADTFDPDWDFSLPECTESGYYKSLQCTARTFERYCWCADPMTGLKLEHTKKQKAGVLTEAECEKEWLGGSADDRLEQNFKFVYGPQWRYLLRDKDSRSLMKDSRWMHRDASVRTRRRLNRN